MHLIIKNIYQFIALALALLMFVTSMNFTMDMHFCQENLLSVNFFGKAETCQKMSETDRMKKCPHYKKMMAGKKKCSMNKKGNCENKTIHFQFEQDQQIQQSTSDINKQAEQFITAYSVVFLFNNFKNKNDLLDFSHYKPPLIYRDIPVLIASFLL